MIEFPSRFNIFIQSEWPSRSGSSQRHLLRRQTQMLILVRIILVDANDMSLSRSHHNRSSRFKRDHMRCSTN